jgi:hypothetical protein
MHEVPLIDQSDIVAVECDVSVTFTCPSVLFDSRSILNSKKNTPDPLHWGIILWVMVIRQMHEVPLIDQSDIILIPLLLLCDNRSNDNFRIRRT